MLSTFPILICCLYALSAVEATPFTLSGSVEVQQGSTKAVKPLNLWSDDKSDDDDKDDKWSKDAEDDKDNKNDNDDCASRSVAVLVGTSTYAIPCLQGDSIVNLNGLIPTPTSSIASSSATEASSSAVSSSAVDSSSSAASSSSALSFEASSATDSTTATTDSTTATTETSTTTDTTTSGDSSPTFTVTLYYNPDCTGGVITTSSGYGCFNNVDSDRVGSIPVFQFSAGTTSTDELTLDFYPADDCLGNIVTQAMISATTCGQNLFSPFTLPFSYRVY